MFRSVRRLPGSTREIVLIVEVRDPQRPDAERDRSGTHTNRRRSRRPGRCERRSPPPSWAPPAPCSRLSRPASRPRRRSPPAAMLPRRRSEHRRATCARAVAGDAASGGPAGCVQRRVVGQDRSLELLQARALARARARRAARAAHPGRPAARRPGGRSGTARASAGRGGARATDARAPMPRARPPAARARPRPDRRRSGPRARPDGIPPTARSPLGRTARRRSPRAPDRATPPAPPAGQPPRSTRRPARAPAGPSPRAPRTGPHRAAPARSGACSRDPWVTSNPSPSALRRFDTYTCTVFAAVGDARSPHSASISRSVETTSPRCSSNTASSARTFGAPTTTGRPSSTTSSGPRIRISTTLS